MRMREVGHVVKWKLTSLLSRLIAKYLSERGGWIDGARNSLSKKKKEEKRERRKALHQGRKFQFTNTFLEQSLRKGSHIPEIAKVIDPHSAALNVALIKC